MISKDKIQLGYLLIAAVFAVICLRLVQLQFFEGDKFRKLSETNRLKILSAPAPRGIIYDRNGIPLVKNIPLYSVYMMYDPAKEPDIAAIAAIVGTDSEEIRARLHKRDLSPFVPVKLRQGLSFQEVARIEACRSDFPELFIQTDVGREYPFGKVGAHIIGYLGKLSQAQAGLPEFSNLPPETLIGQWGIESLYDSHLRGVAGGKIIEVDALGREQRFIQDKPAIRGKDVILSIDIAMQKAIEDAFGEKAGALVALKVDTGEVLALESLPSFDPNKFTHGIKAEDWKALMSDKRKPMMNRALQSQYPPGSTFKVAMAVAGLETGVITPDTTFNCSGGITYGKWTFGCWRKGGHGSVNLHRAIKESCDVYFYELGKRLGINRIHKYATALGLGSDTGLGLQKERQGLIPNTEWKRARRGGAEWYLGETFNASIGQGYVAVTPIQLALMTATVSNGGSVMQTTLIKDPKEVHVRSKIDLDPETVRLILKGLSAVVNEDGGTARIAASSIVKIGGKTGTAQVVSKLKAAAGERFMDHAWFLAVAPADKPEVAVASFVEHGGHGGSAAGPIAKKAIEAYFLNKKKAEQAQGVESATQKNSRTEGKPDNGEDNDQR
jgi:penicillin-binding protein 2